MSKQNDLLWEERDALSRCSDLADILIEQAIDDNQNMDNQNRIMQGVDDKNSRIRGSLLDSNRISRSIGWYQHKNTLVLACVCACCIFFLIWWKFL